LIAGARRMLVQGVNFRHGAADGGGGDDTPSVDVRVTGTLNKLVMQGCDLSHTAAALSLAGGATYAYKAITDCSGLSNERINTTAASLQYHTKFGWHYGRYEIQTLTLSTTTEFLFSVPALSTNTRQGLEIVLIAVKPSTGGDSMVSWRGMMERLSGSAAISSTTMTGTALNGSSIQTSIGTATGTLQITITNMATDGSTFGFSINNTDSADWQVHSLVCRPY
jgi:hypothetical protein